MQLSSRKSGPLRGAARIPGDKSISHRALMIGAVATGETIISGLLESADIHATAMALRALGVRIGRDDSGLWQVRGRGPDALRDPAQVLDMGNSGTGVRLLAGLVAGLDVTATFAGDASLSKRPMKRVLEPLAAMGAEILARDGVALPFTLRGAGTRTKPLTYDMPVPSAQVKSAILLAGLFADGETIITESRRTRDHTEIMLVHYGADITATDGRIVLKGGKLLPGGSVQVPGDPSAAAFIAAATVLNGESEVTMNRICVNPTRIGFYEVLREMGADIVISRPRCEYGELVADITIRGDAKLSGIDVNPERIPAMVDEVPILAAVAACADGVTRLRGLAELRVKESDRVALMAAGLLGCGVDAGVSGDDMTIRGNGHAPRGGALIDTAMDHRIAMSFLTLGTVTEEPVTIDDERMIGTSFPGFAAVLNDLGAAIAPPDEPVFATDP